MRHVRTGTNAIGLAGEFAALSQLALRGYDANLTLGNTKGVDILVSDPDSGLMFRLEVKTSGYLNVRGSASKRSRLFGHCYEWILSKRNEDLVDPSLFYCFVNLSGSEGTSFRFFVVPSEIVATYVRDQHRLWLDRDPARKDTPMRVFRLGLEDGDYPLPTPLAERYEDDWTFGP